MPPNVEKFMQALKQIHFRSLKQHKKELQISFLERIRWQTRPKNLGKEQKS